jgi:hypothetical protein
VAATGHLGTRRRRAHQAARHPGLRSALILGKSFAAGIRSLSQVIVVLVLAAILGVTLTPTCCASPGRSRS